MLEHVKREYLALLEDCATTQSDLELFKITKLQHLGRLEQIQFQEFMRDNPSKWDRPTGSEDVRASMQMVGSL